jgi:hypothetical protein
VIHRYRVVISAENVKSFENRHWENHPMIFNYELDYNTKHQLDTQTTFQEERPDVEPNMEGLTMPLLLEQT